MTHSYNYDRNRVLVFLTRPMHRDYFCYKSNPHESPDVCRRRTRRIRTIGKGNDLQARLSGKFQAQASEQVSRGVPQCPEASVFCGQSHHAYQTCGHVDPRHSASLTDHCHPKAIEPRLNITRIRTGQVGRPLIKKFVFQPFRILKCLKSPISSLQKTNFATFKTR